MPRIRLALAVIGLLLPFTIVGQGTPQEPSPAKNATRKLLYPANVREVPAVLKPHVERLLDPDQKAVEPADVKPNGVYLRVLSKQFAIADGKPKTGGWLGSKPFVFVTIPETAYGRDVLGVLAAIGYDLEEILDSEKGIEKVAVVFAFPEKVRLSDVRDGALLDDWDQRIHPSTWDNLLSLAEKMTGDKPRWVAVRPEGDGFMPTKLQFRSDREASFLLSFPDEGKKRVKTTDYAALREIGGSDWVYRQLIERLLGASEHFRGDGRTKLTLAGKRKPRLGYPEFVGPNAELTGLPAMAIISLGTLRVEQ